MKFPISKKEFFSGLKQEAEATPEAVVAESSGDINL